MVLPQIQSVFATIFFFRPFDRCQFSTSGAGLLLKVFRVFIGSLACCGFPEFLFTEFFFIRKEPFCRSKI
jgi:hypothetical protein